MKPNLLLISLLLYLVTFSFSKTYPRLGKACREEKNGWIYIHLEGSPEDIGYQHGYLLVNEIDDAIHMFKYVLPHETHRDWNYFRNLAKKMYWNKIPKEYKDELQGIAQGMAAKGKHYDVYDIVVLNASTEWAGYYLPYLANKQRADSVKNKAPGNCSAFIATGSYTKDGKIVIGHSCWTDYFMGERYNIIADIVPTHGHHILMDIFPGFIESGDDFAMNSAGICITETTIAGFMGFDTSGIPEFVRARESEQYSNNIDDFIRIMVQGNNGAYANDWLVGDIKTNEIARLELGLKNHPVWRTKDGAYIGSNFPSDKKLAAEETNFNINDSSTSPIGRECRWNVLMQENKGKIDAETGMQMESDNYDQLTHQHVENGCVIAGSLDTDPRGAPELGEKPYAPFGAVQAKVASAAMIKDMSLWAHIGNPDGKDFVAAPFFKAHPEYEWQAKYLGDMKARPWTLFNSKGPAQ
jgi:Phospholipase B